MSVCVSWELDVERPYKKAKLIYDSKCVSVCKNGYNFVLLTQLLIMIDVFFPSVCAAVMMIG